MLLDRKAILLAVACLAACSQPADPESSKTDTAVTTESTASKAKPSRLSTKADNVTVLSDTFQYPEGEYRDVWVYLPPDYDGSDERYPVLYMHDGQNVFDDATSYVGEWHVDETLNSLSESGVKVPIVVAINHGGEKRMQELSPWENREYGKARGKAYLDFIITDVKPYIDKYYRTLSGPGDTAMMGSSMGGLMTHYAIVSHPDVFTKAAVFSPSFWYAKDVFDFTESRPLPDSHRLFFVVGEKEGEGMVQGMEAMVALHQAQQHDEQNLYWHTEPGAEHNEAFWSGQVAPALAWLGMLKERGDAQ